MRRDHYALHVHELCKLHFVTHLPNTPGNKITVYVR